MGHIPAYRGVREGDGAGALEFGDLFVSDFRLRFWTTQKKFVTLKWLSSPRFSHQRFDQLLEVWSITTCLRTLCL